MQLLILPRKKLLLIINENIVIYYKNLDTKNIKNPQVSILKLNCHYFHEQKQNNRKFELRGLLRTRESAN